VLGVEGPLLPDPGQCLLAAEAGGLDGLSKLTINGRVHVVIAVPLTTVRMGREVLDDGEDPVGVSGHGAGAHQQPTDGDDRAEDGQSRHHIGHHRPLSSAVSLPAAHVFCVHVLRGFSYVFS